MVQKYGCFNVPPEHRELYINCLVEFYSQQVLLKENPGEAKNRAMEVYNNLIEGLTPDGEAWTMASMTRLDSRVRSVTKGLWKGSKDTQKNQVVYTIQRGEGNKSALSEDDIFKFLKDTEAKDFQDEMEALIKQYPDLNRGDVRKDVELYCAINVQLRRLSLQSGRENDLKKLVDAKVLLGNFLGLSEKLRMEEIIKQQKENIAALAYQFDQTVREYPELIKRMHVKELKMLLNKYDRGELPEWLFRHPSHAAMSVEEARRIVSENENIVYI